MDQLAWLFHQVLELHQQIHRDLSAQMSGLADGNGAFFAVAALAFCLGAVHALTPGHGKVVLFAYFLGRRARPWAGLLAAAQIACLHVGTAIVLVLAIGGAAYVLGRPTGVAFALQAISALAVTTAGAWYLKRALGGGSRSPLAAHSHTGIATAVGILPCPLTMLILSAAFTDATLTIGLMLVAVMGLGIMVTIGLIGSIGVAAQRGLAAGFGEAPTRYSAVLRCLEVGSAVAILVIGLSSLLAL
jgi:nickel/cobalt transporter (NicO) family protein